MVIIVPDHWRCLWHVTGEFLDLFANINLQALSLSLISVISKYDVSFSNSQSTLSVLVQHPGDFFKWLYI